MAVSLESGAAILQLELIAIAFLLLLIALIRYRRWNITLPKKDFATAHVFYLNFALYELFAAWSVSELTGVNGLDFYGLY